MDVVAPSIKKKVMGHATVILLLCLKASVADLTDGQMIYPGKELNSYWIGSMSVKEVQALDHKERYKRPSLSTCTMLLRGREHHLHLPFYRMRILKHTWTG